MILSYPGLFKNIPHVWFLRLYSFLKNPQHDFPKMRGGGQRPFGTFPKIHPFWEGDATLSILKQLYQRYRILRQTNSQRFVRQPGLLMPTVTASSGKEEVVVI